MKLFKDVLDFIREKLGKPVSVGFGRLEGWTEDVEFFRFKCREHGDQVSYPSGHENVLLCPRCLGSEVIYPRVNWVKGRC